MKILLTGATGFVGKNLLPKILVANQVAILVRDKKKALDLFSNQIIKIIDINDPNYITKIQEFDATVVIHLATFLQSKVRNEENIIKYVNSNILFGTQLLNALVGTNLKYFVNIGTCLEYRNNCSELFSSDLYSATKTAFRSILSYYQNLIGFKWLNVIPFSIYGDGAPKIVLDFICESLLSKEPIRFTGGHQIIDLVHIENVVDFFIQLIEGLPTIERAYTEFEIGTCIGISIRDLATMFERVSGKKTNILWGNLEYSELASMRNVANPFKIYAGWKANKLIDYAIFEYLEKYNIPQIRSIEPNEDL